MIEIGLDDVRVLRQLCKERGAEFNLEGDAREELIAIEDLDGLLALVQAGVLEVHVWGSTIDRVDVTLVRR